MEEFITEILLAIPQTPALKTVILLQLQGELLRQGHIHSPFTSLHDCILRQLSPQKSRLNKHHHPTLTSVHPFQLLRLWRGHFLYVCDRVASEHLFAEFHRVLSKFLRFRTKSRFLHFLLKITTSTIASSLTFLATAPIKFVYLQLIAQDFQNNGGEVSAMADIVLDTYTFEGLGGFYHGILLNSICSAIFATVHTIHASIAKAKVKRAWVFSTLIYTCLSFPFETLHYRMMLAGGGVPYSSPIKAFQDIVSVEGVSALFAGLPLSLIVNIVFNMFSL